MPRMADALSAVQVRRLTAPGFYAVGEVVGLYLQVAKTGARSWILRIKVGDRRRDIGLGSFPSVTLSMARESAREMREQVRQGFDPVAERQAARRALVATQAKQMTFAEAAQRKHAAISEQFRNAKHAKQWISTLERYAFPAIGKLDMDEIELPHILKVLEPIWTTKTETATRIRQRMESVFNWAIVAGYRKGENPARWQGNLQETLPKPNKVARVSHHRALPWRQMAPFMEALRKRAGIGARALEFAILTAARSGEVRGATWDEIDFDAKVWRIPGERMKAGKPHTVPLSDDAIAVLRATPRTADYVFASAKGGKISDMSLTAVMRRMDVDATVHGFRSSFKDWARNLSGAADEVSELALAHVNSDATRAAYARDELLPARKWMMTRWAQFCSQPATKSPKVASIGATHA